MAGVQRLSVTLALGSERDLISREWSRQQQSKSSRSLSGAHSCVDLEKRSCRVLNAEL